MSSDMLLSPVASSAPTRIPQSPPPAVSLPIAHSSANVCFPALPFVAYSSSSRTCCSACHQPILLGDIRVDCLHLDCVSSAHVGQWLSLHPQLARSFMRLPSLASLLPEDRRRAALLLHTLAQQCIQRAASPPSAVASQRPPPLQPLCAAGEHLPSIREDSVLSPTPLVTHHLPSPSRMQRQRTAPTSAAFNAPIAAFLPPPNSSAALSAMSGAPSNTVLSLLPGHKRKRVASDGTVQVVESEWLHEPTLLSPVDSDSAMAGTGGGGRKKRRRSHEYVSMLT